MGSWLVHLNTKQKDYDVTKLFPCPKFKTLPIALTAPNPSHSHPLFLVLILPLLPPSIGTYVPFNPHPGWPSHVLIVCTYLIFPFSTLNV
jgi:hypothetical protein